jgi:hypothetical protein
MNRLLYLYLSCLALQAALPPLQVMAGQPLKLAHHGSAGCSIIIAEKPTPSARLAALELQYHFLKMSGMEVPILSESASVPGIHLLVGDSTAVRQLGFRSNDFEHQEYVVAFRSNAIVLLGRDWQDTEANRKAEGRPMIGESIQDTRHKIDYWKAVGYPQRSNGEVELPGLYDDQGTCLAVYDFLERFCGVRWYGPSTLNVVIPTQADLVVSGDDVRRSPALKSRSALPSGNWPFLRGQWGEFTADQLRLYWRRSRQGGEPWAANHTFYPRTIQAVFSDPEYQSKNPRTKGSQLCYSNPKLIQQVAQMARDYFDGKGHLPEGWKAMGDYFAIVPDDNMNLCNCPDCAALLQKGRDQKTGFFSSGEMSEYWFTFVNAVAREVRTTHPDKDIATLAYWAYAVPPSFPLESNVSIAPCLHTCYYPVHAGMRDNDFKFYEGWHEITHAPTFLWVYYHHPMEPALIDKWNCFPHVMVHETASAMRRFIQDGVRGIFECGEQDQLEQYVMAKVWDDPTLDVDAVISEFFRLYFETAAAPMQKFYSRLEQIACDPANYQAPYHKKDGVDWKRAAWESLGTEDRMEELGKLMAQAETLASSPQTKQRVALWRSALWDWMRQGREKYVEAKRVASPEK